MSERIEHSVNTAPRDWDAQQTRRQASFLQSGHWGLFQRQMGRQAHFFSSDGWSCLLLERRTPLGSYWLAPYGPTLGSATSLPGCLKYLNSQARQAGADWLVLEPMLGGRGSSELAGIMDKFGAKKASHDREPDLTRIINLAPAADELLSGVSQSTRSFIRKNQREGLLSFRTSADPKDIASFTRMLGHVTDRNRVFFFPDEYFHQQAEILMPAGMLHMEIALQAGRPIASALLHDYGEQSSYTYAASLPEARQTNASALLLWQALLNAKHRGRARLDLFGIAPDDAPRSHPWHGFSVFKQKFGGEVVAYSGTWDIPLTSKYRIYRAARRLRGRA